MVKDLPDFNSQVYEESVEAGSLDNGLDANKSATPDVGDVYIATNTKKLYICFVDNVWTNAGALYLLLAGGTMSGAIAMSTKKITGLPAPTAGTEPARKTENDATNAKLDDTSVTSPTRALDTEYQNTSGKLLLVMITVTLPASSLSEFQMDSTSSVSTVHGEASNGATGDSIVETITALVPKAWYYKLVDQGGTPSVTTWRETELF